MLSAAQRVRRSADFAATIRGGRRAGRGTVVVHLLLEEPAQASTARAGFVVSKAVGNAVVRNKVRRRLRHLVRPLLGDLPAGALLVVRALPAAADGVVRHPRRRPRLGADGRPAAPAAAMSLLARVLTAMVVAYRRYVSPALPARCRFYPSCSAYALEALARHGAVRGTGLAVWRLLRCHPFHPGGYDPVPDPIRHRPADVTGA